MKEREDIMRIEIVHWKKGALIRMKVMVKLKDHLSYTKVLKGVVNMRLI